VPPAALTLRRARPADAATLARTACLGYETWRAFAPPGWAPRPFAAQVARTRQRLERSDAWALLAFCAGEPAGHCSLLRGDHGGPRSAYLWQLFVRPAWWASGLAERLHDAFLAQGRERGYPSAWLSTPAGHVRARRFYERRGWRLDGPPEDDEGMPMVVYGRALLP
jgi:GNAT superfamily N-acetyltransferase